MLKKIAIENSEGKKFIQLEIADSFLRRFLGLMCRKKLPQGQGLWISPCNSIHMLFMRFSIDAVYLDKNCVVKKIVRNLRPWLGVSICFGAQSVIEFAAGESARLNLKIGDKFLFNQ